MPRKILLYNKAIRLRQQGFSYTEILESIPVAQSTMSRWCSTIPLTKEQQDRLDHKRDNNPFIKSLKEKALKTDNEARSWAVNRLKDLPGENILLVSGLLLYWAEGADFTSSFTIEFTNTDSNMISLMMRFFREIFNVPKDKFKLTVRIRKGEDLKIAEKYWLGVTGLTTDNLRRSEILEKCKRPNKYPRGICRIVIHDVVLAKRLIYMIKEFIKQFALVV